MKRHRGARGAQQRPEHHHAADDAGSGWLRQLGEIARDPARWPELDEDTLLLIVFQQCLYLAHSGDAEAASALAELYPHAASRVGTRERMELLERVTSAVEENGTPVAALLPFLQHDPDPGIVTLAAGAFATLAPLEEGEPLTGPNLALRMAEHAEDEGTRVGLVAGVLELGDRRALPALLAAWDALAPAARERLAGLRPASPLAFAAVAEFWLAALERSAPADRGAPAAALARLAREADPRRVLDVRRKFPAHANDERETIEIVDDAPLEEFGRRMADRLAAVADGAELAAVRAAWGLDPRS